MGYPLPTASIPGSSFRGDDERSRRVRELLERQSAERAEADQGTPSSADMQQPPVSGYQIPAGDSSDLPNPRRPAQQPAVSGYQIPAGDSSDMPGGGPPYRPFPDVTRGPQRYEHHWATGLPPEPESSFPTAAQVGASMPGSVAVDRLKNPRMEMGAPVESGPPVRLPQAPPAPAARLSKSLQQLQAEANQRGVESRAAAASPATAAGRAAAAVDGYANRTGGENYREEVGARREARSLTQDTAEHERATAAHDAKRRTLESRLEQARAAGNEPLQDALMEQLAAHEESAPRPTLRMTGGKTPEELDESLDATTAKLTAGEKAALDAAATRYATGQDGTVSEQAKQDFMWGQFADMPPAERLEAMRAAANRGPAPLQVASGGGTPGGRGSKVGDQAGKKSAEAASRTDNDRRDGGYPVGKNAGMLVQNPDGSYSSRAPRMDQLEAVGQVEPNPDKKTPEWRQQMLAIGQNAFGLQRDKYAPGPEGDNMLIADTRKKLERHQQLLDAGYKASEVETGGFRYVPVKGGEAQKATERAGRQAQTRNFLKANAVDPATAAKMWAEADGGATPSLQTQVLRDRDNAARNSLQDNREMQQWARQFQNPGMAQQMLRSSLAQAGDDLDAQAVVFDSFGLHAQADRLRGHQTTRVAHAGDAKIAQQQADAETTKAEAAKAAASGKEAPPDAGTHMERARTQALDALDGEGGPRQALSLYALGHNQMASSDESGKIKPMNEAGAAIPLATAIVASGGLTSANRGHVVDMAIKQLFSDGLPADERGWTRGAFGRWPDAESFANHVEKMLGQNPAVREMALRYYANKRGEAGPDERVQQAAPRQDIPAPTRL